FQQRGGVHVVAEIHQPHQSDQQHRQQQRELDGGDAAFVLAKVRAPHLMIRRSPMAAAMAENALLSSVELSAWNQCPEPAQFFNMVVTLVPKPMTQTVMLRFFTWSQAKVKRFSTVCVRLYFEPDAQRRRAS